MTARLTDALRELILADYQARFHLAAIAERRDVSPGCVEGVIFRAIRDCVIEKRPEGSERGYEPVQRPVAARPQLSEVQRRAVESLLQNPKGPRRRDDAVAQVLDQEARRNRERQARRRAFA